MNFKEALIAHLHGKKVEVASKSNKAQKYKKFSEWHESINLTQIEDDDFAVALEYRLAPRTIIVNGVEVPAPEKAEPENGVDYYVPDAGEDDYAYGFTWSRDGLDLKFLARGQVYLHKEDAIARAKAMLIVKEG